MGYEPSKATAKVAGSAVIWYRQNGQGPRTRGCDWMVAYSAVTK